MSTTKQNSESKQGNDSCQNTEKSWWDLTHWDDLPKWMQDNQHIYSGYRQPSYSYSRSFASALQMHNETVNIWSHGIPALLSLPMAVYLYSVLGPRYIKASTGDIVTMGIFFASAALALGMSATYHTVSNHSPSVAKKWNQLDYAGIACLIAGSFVPCVYYGFWCNQTKQIVYWTMISILGVGCTTASVLPKFRTPAWRPVRAGMFIGMGLSAVFPVLDGLREFGFEQMRKQMGFLWVVLQGGLYILGASLYAVGADPSSAQSPTADTIQMRWPERSSPGQFDMIGSSHQIFHVLVVSAAVSHLIGLLKAFDYRHGSYGAVC